MNEETISRKERDKQIREDDFLNAAESLFAERGYYETAMEDVAAKAEYATGTVYRYFESKEALYHRLLLRKGKAFFDAMESALNEAPTALEKLETLIRRKTNFFYTNKEFVRIYLYEASRPSSGSRYQPPKELAQRHGEYLESIRNIFRLGMGEGVFRDLDVNMTLPALMGLDQEIMTLTLEDDFEQTEDEVVGFIMNFLRGGLIKESANA